MRAFKKNNPTKIVQKRRKAYKGILALILIMTERRTYMGRKKKSIKSLADGIEAYEKKKDALQGVDFTDLESFKAAYLNESDPKRKEAHRGI